MKLTIGTVCATLILAVSTANAWTFTYRNSAGTPSVASNGDNNKQCTSITHAAGQTFEWDRGFWSDCCVSLYTNRACNGDPAGYSCSDWKKAASVTLLSYKVTNC
ncbi:hypothetical protein FRC20_004887 [Serendipita sp. 405]|nr:hypothetical protein FRC20_004887 [Serendipita sp. 405]